MTIRYLISVVSLCIAFAACKKKGSDEPQPTPIVIVPKDTTKPSVDTIKYGKAVMHLHTFVGDEELEGFDDVVTVSGSERRISMSIGSVYMSHFELVDMNNTIIKMCDTTLVKTPEEISYYISKIPIGRYKALRFKVAFDTTSKANKLISKEEGEPNSIHIAYFKGKLDTASVPDENNTRVGYEYALTSRTKEIQVVLPVRGAGTEFNILEKGSEYFHLYMDLNVLFSGLKLNDPKSLRVLTPEENNSEVADKVADNISKMFRYE